MLRIKRRRFIKRSSCPRTSGGAGSTRSARTCANTTSTPGSSCSLRRWKARSLEARLPPMGELSHVTEAGEVRMVDVGAKPHSRRRAVARGSVGMASTTAARLRELPKGDALVTAQIAGIMAAKRTAELIPLCHPLPLPHVEVHVEISGGRVDITAGGEETAQEGGGGGAPTAGRGAP